MMTNRFTILAICLAVGLGTVADQAMAKKKNKNKNNNSSSAELYDYDHPSGKGYPNGRPWQALEYDFEIVKHKLNVLDYKVDDVKGDTETIIEQLDDVQTDIDAIETEIADIKDYFIKYGKGIDSPAKIVSVYDAKHKDVKPISREETLRRRGKID